MSDAPEIRRAVARVVDGHSLSAKASHAVMHEIMSGVAPEPLIAAYLIALRMKGETIDEISGSARAMREKAHRIKSARADAVDTCGTGGDGLHTINVSTAAALVAAAAGCAVAKHGNRSVSSRSGSVDVLEVLGVRVDASPEEVERCLDEVGIGILFAPRLHPAMKHAMPVRRALGCRTLFNLLGPLTNPAGTTRQLMGIFDRRWIAPVAAVLGELGAEHALVVHGSDGMDEITITGPTFMAEWKDGRVAEWTFHPRDAGLDAAALSDIAGGTAEENAGRILDVLEGRDTGPARDIIALNAGAVCYVAGRAATIREGAADARAVIASGRARDTLSRLVASLGTAP